MSVGTPPPESPESPSPLSKMRRQGIHKPPVPEPDFPPKPHPRQHDTTATTPLRGLPKFPKPYDAQDFLSPSSSSMMRAKTELTLEVCTTGRKPVQQLFPRSSSSTPSSKVLSARNTPVVQKERAPGSRSQGTTPGATSAHPSGRTPASPIRIEHDLDSVITSSPHIPLRISTTAHPKPLGYIPELAAPLGYVPIASNDRVQRYLDYRGIAWGVQWQIARGISQGEWKWEDVTVSKLHKLEGLNAEAAPKVEEWMSGKDTPSSTTATSDRDYLIWFVVFRSISGMTLDWVP
jgi:hypothetical protein